MNDDDYDAPTVVQNPPQGRRLKLGLIKRNKHKRSTTPTMPSRTATAPSMNGLTGARSSADLSMMTSNSSNRLTMMAGQTPPGIMTPPRTPSSATFSIGAPREVPTCDHPHDWKEITRVQVDMTVTDIFDLMYVGSKYLVKFLEDRKTTEIIIGGMGPMSDGLRGRTSTFTVPIGAGATAKMTQIETWRPCSDLEGGLHSTDIEVLSAGVPYAESYTVLLHVCAKKIGENRSEFGVWAKINYKKQVWKVAKMAVESLVWRQVGLFYGGMGPSVEEAGRMSREERETWKTILFPLDAPGGGITGASPPVPDAASPPPAYTSIAQPVANGSVPSAAPTVASPSSVASLAASLPVPYWWIMFLLLSLTWLNAFMVARLFTASPDPVITAGVHPTAVAPFPAAVHAPSDFSMIDWRRFVDDQKQFRQTQVDYWKRVADMAGILLREAEMSLDSLDGIMLEKKSPDSKKNPVKNVDKIIGDQETDSGKVR